MKTRQNRRGFTLIEVLIVVVIMAVLAATIIPQFSSSTTDAKNSALDFNLHTLRSQIELYKIHHGEYPALTDASIPGLMEIKDGFGPYLDGSIPNNPLDNKNAVTKPEAVPPAAAVGAAGGWQYDVNTGGIWPNHADWVNEDLPVAP